MIPLEGLALIAGSLACLFVIFKYALPSLGK